MKTICFTAQPFGFGPVSKMLAVSESIFGVHKIFFGSGTAYDLARIHSFDEVYEINSDGKEKIFSLLKRSDAFVNAMDFQFIDLSVKANCPCLLIDSLFWWWPKIHDSACLADIYFCQNFIEPIDVRVQENQLTNVSIIGPIVSENFEKRPKINQAIINFGGCDGRIDTSFIEVGKNSEYPLIVLKLLLPLLSQYKSVLVTGKSNVMKLCKSKFGGGKVRFCTFTPKQMLEELYRSEVCFTTPGIQTFYDAGDKLPIYFLPPSNHSHVSNLDLFIEKGIAKYCFRWRDVDNLYIRNYSSRQEKIDIVLKAIRYFSKSEEQQQFFIKSVDYFLENKDGWMNQIGVQKRIIDSMGEPGVEAIISKITQLFTFQNNQSMITL